MKTRTHILTGLLSTTLMLGCTQPSYTADNITADTVRTATAPISREEASDPRVAATSFVEHVNYARVALAMKKSSLAQQHITQASNMITLIKSAKVEERRITEVESGRIVYQYDTEYKYHYFPIQAGPVQVKKISNGPVWATNDLAVTDADVVYLTLDLTDDKASTYLKDAQAAIRAGNLKAADSQLAQLTNAVITVDSKASMPNDKARDNIALARHFITAKNYDGARYALEHADEALDEMQRNDMYKVRRTDIIAMRKDVSDMQNYIAKKDPTMIEQTSAKLDKWWKDMKSWSSNY